MHIFTKLEIKKPIMTMIQGDYKPRFSASIDVNICQWVILPWSLFGRAAKHSQAALVPFVAFGAGACNSS